MVNFISDFIKFQGEVKNLSKDSDNPYFKSKYLGLDSALEFILPLLNKHNFCLIQSPSFDEDAIVLETCLYHVSGESLIKTMRMVPADSKPQTVGSCITYMRRYALLPMTGITGENDDDGSLASGIDKEADKKPEHKPVTDKGGRYQKTPPMDTKSYTDLKKESDKKAEEQKKPVDIADETADFNYLMEVSAILTDIPQDVKLIAGTSDFYPVLNKHCYDSMLKLGSAGRINLSDAVIEINKVGCKTIKTMSRDQLLSFLKGYVKEKLDLPF